jgi:cell division protein ZipA
MASDPEEATWSESRERTKVLGTQGSEDVRHLLGKIDLPPRAAVDDEREYLPEPAVEWVVDVRWPGNPQLDPRAVSETLETSREALGSFMPYGRDVANGEWTYLVSSDGPRAVDQVKVAFNYVPLNPEDAPPGEKQYAQRLELVRQQMQKFGAATVTASLPPKEAAERSRALYELREELDMSAVLILQAPRGKRFDGKAIWDVMLCLGLEWGDMDCFHWRNESDQGDDAFFSVETTTEPGYFLPEDIAAGELQVEDLVFVFSVPRSARPVEVFDGMTRAVEYCRKRLGGTIVDPDGDPLQPADLREQIEEVTQELRDAGLEPGAGATLQLF